MTTLRFALSPHTRTKQRFSAPIPFMGIAKFFEEEIMDKDRIVGSAKQVKGAVKQAVGKAVGDAKLESEGKADKSRARFRTLSAASKTRSKGVTVAGAQRFAL